MAVTLTNSQLSAGLYSAFWNRAPDATGQNFWVGKLNGGVSTLAVATEFYNAPEGLGAYPNWMRNDKAALITEVYNSVFNRAPDTGGLAFWTAQLTTDAQGVVSNFPQVVLNMMQSAVDSAAAGNTDGQQFLNEIQVGIYVSETLRTDDPAITSIAFDGVTYEESSVAVREAELDAMVNHGETYTLTTSVDNITGTQYADTFNAPLDNGLNTLNALDSLNGNGGIDTLNAVIATSVTPAHLDNIEVLNATFSGGGTLGLINAGQLTNVNNVGSTVAATFNGIATDADLGVNGTGSDTTFNFATVAGVQEANLTLTNVTAGTETVAGIETINVVSAGYDNTAVLTAADANTVTIAGDADLTLTTTGTLSASLWDASTTTGDVDLTVLAQTGVAASVNVSINGGFGNDDLRFDGVTQKVSVDGGEGDDTFYTATNLNDTDTIIGGSGVDTLETTFAAASGLTSVNGVNGIDVLSLTTALNGAINSQTVDSTIVEVDVSVAAGGALSAAASTVTGGAGTFQVDLGGSYAATTGVLGHTLEIADTGTATTDTLNINNLAIDNRTNQQLNVFAGQAVTSTGYENVAINTGTAVAATQTISTLTITGEAAANPLSLTLSGASNIDISTSLTAGGGSTGLLSVDASGLTGASGTVLDINAITSTGTVSITGSEGNDLLGQYTNATTYTALSNLASTIVAGAGLDTVIGGTLADSIDGGAGNDFISGGGGNDVLKGGEGADTIKEMVAGAASIDGGAGDDNIFLGTELTVTDTVDGGEGYDYAILSNVTASTIGATAGAQLSNIEAISFDGAGALAQDLSVFSNTTVDTVANSLAAGALVLTKASASTNKYDFNTATTVANSFRRETDTTTDALTIRATAAIGAGAGLTVTDEETITVNAQTFAADLDLLAATDLTTLNVTGSGAGAIVLDAAGATLLSSIDASGLTGTHTLNVDGTDSTTAITFVGGAYTGNTTISGGTGADVFTAGTGALYANGNGGNDSLTGGAAADSLSGGIGADTLVGGTGTDSLLGGVGIDTFIVNGANVVQDLGVNNQADILVVATGATATTAVTGNWTATSASQNNAATAAGAALTMGAAVTTVNLDAVTGTTGWTVTAGAAATLITGSDFADTLSAAASTAGGVQVTGGVGADTITTDSAATTVNYDVAGLTIAEQTGYATQAVLDVVVGFTSGGDELALGVAGLATGGGNVTNYAEVANAAYADYAAVLTAGNTSLAATAGTTTSTVAYAFVGDTTSGNGFLFIDTDLNGVADAGIQLTGVQSGDIALTDIVA